MIYSAIKIKPIWAFIFVTGLLLACNLTTSAGTSQATSQPLTQTESVKTDAPVLALPTATATAKATTTQTLPPTATATASPTATATVPAATLIPGSITGLVWHDLNRNGKKDAGESGMGGLTISLGEGACLSYGFKADITLDTGTFFFSGIAPGVYCVRLIPDVSTRTITTLNPVTVTLGSGKTETVNFGMF
jgi:hypothetical protein